MPSIDLSGKKFGRLTVIGKAEKIKNKPLKWQCSCECGTTTFVRADHLLRGSTKSCGCPSNNKHGMWGSPEYWTWAHMKDRCYNKKSAVYDHYGGRGITVCDRWLESYANFYSDMGNRPSNKHSLDRTNNSGNYEPSNCRWATRSVQTINTRNRKNNSGVRGVYASKKNWEARIGVFGEEIRLGYFNNKEDAIAARKEAELKYHAPLLGN